MWTPKRILLLTAGFALFFTAFQVYAHFLGGIDGLPPLPEEYLPGDDPGTVIVLDRRGQNQAERMLRMAFGSECPEVKEQRDILEVRSRGMVLAFKDFDIIDGRVRLMPISIAIFGKSIPDTFPEINTIRAEVAYLTFDRPVSSVAEMNNRKISEGELEGGIRIRNNRRTPQVEDDIIIDIPKGPLFYREGQLKPWTETDTKPQIAAKDTRPHLWTNHYVRLVDRPSQPDATKIQAIGMDLYLTRVQPAPPPGQPKATKPKGEKSKSEGIAGVDQVILKSAVEMHLFVDSNSPFLGGDDSKAGAGKNSASPKNKPVGKLGGDDAPPQAKAEVVITTSGQFRYDIGKEADLAQFDVPVPDPRHPSPFAEDVHVTRFNKPHTDAPVVYHVKVHLGGFSTCATLGPLPQEGSAVADKSEQRFKVHFGFNPFHLKPIIHVAGEEPAYLEDQLLCEHLQLQFHRKSADDDPAPKIGQPVKPAGPKDNSTPSLEIQSAHATGQTVTLTSESEMLEAHGNDFFYDARTRLTKLKGDPEMWALKEGNEIHARELELIRKQIKRTVKEETVLQEVMEATALGKGAKGRGTIDLFDKNTGKRPLHASWTTSFSSARDGDFEVLTLVGDAVFQDDEHNQVLRADKLEIWLEPAKQDTDPKAKPNGTTTSSQGRQPHLLKANGRVVARSTDWRIHNTDSLIVRFHRVENKTAAPISQTDKGTSGQYVVVAPTVQPLKPAINSGASVANPILPPKKVEKGSVEVAAPAPAPPPNPIDLSARRVEVDVAVDGPKNDLQSLHAEGSVHVKQDPKPAQEKDKAPDKGVDILGDDLELTHFVDGNKVVVTGGDDLPQLQLDKLVIWGPVVTIDQVKNIAEVMGVGAMRIDSDTDFQGNPQKKPVPMTIHWNDHMFFDGKWAEFHGGIQAEQGDARLACQVLQVYLDQAVSLKEGNKSGQPARVQDLICDRNVHLKETTFENKKIVKDQRIDCAQLTLDNRAALEAKDKKGGGNVNASAGKQAGTVRIYQPGAKDVETAPSVPAPKGGKAKPAEEEMKLTYISYAGWMTLDNEKRLATFVDDVKVLYMPADNPDIKVDLDNILNKMPKNAFFLKCDTLKVLTHVEKDPKNKAKEITSQEMIAKGRATVQGQGFSGRALEIHYEETKEIVGFVGTENEPARLYKFNGRGVKPDEIVAEKIYYNRLTGEHWTSKATKFDKRN